jgi:hypothetical protein
MKNETKAEPQVKAATRKITGNAAIEYAARTGSQLYCYANPLDDGGLVSIEQAREIAREDAGLIYVIEQQLAEINGGAL